MAGSVPVSEFFSPDSIAAIQHSALLRREHRRGLQASNHNTNPIEGADQCSATTPSASSSSAASDWP